MPFRDLGVGVARRLRELALGIKKGAGQTWAEVVIWGLSKLVHYSIRSCQEVALWFLSLVPGRSTPMYHTAPLAPWFPLPRRLSAYESRGAATARVSLLENWN